MALLSSKLSSQFTTGATGVAGATGAQGASGVGATGVAGATGVGVQGASGSTGLTGASGIAGATGSAASGNPAGTIIQFAGTTAPTGYLLCPTSATTISRTTYADLFSAIGTTWGAGNGSTTFGLPWFAANYAAVQANSNVGTTTVGEVIAHTHSYSVPTGGCQGWTAGYGGITTDTTGSTGGAANLAAGVRVLFCIKF